MMIMSIVHTEMMTLHINASADEKGSWAISSILVADQDIQAQRKGLYPFPPGTEEALLHELTTASTHASRHPSGTRANQVAA